MTFLIKDIFVPHPHTHSFLPPSAILFVEISLKTKLVSPAPKKSFSWHVKYTYQGIIKDRNPRYKKPI